MAQTDPPDNVVRFPREWFGSTDDLVPIVPAAAPAESADVAEPPVLGGSSFWTGDSWALQDALERPAEAAADPSPRSNFEPDPRMTPKPPAAGARPRIEPPPSALRGTFGSRARMRTVAALATAAAVVAALAWTTLASSPARTAGAPARLGTIHTAAALAGLSVLDNFASARFVVHHTPQRLRATLGLARRHPQRHRSAPQRPGRTSPSTPQLSYVSTTAPSTSANGSYTTSTASNPAPVSSTPVYSQADVTQPAFGPSGALGPGYSPNG